MFSVVLLLGQDEQSLLKSQGFLEQMSGQAVHVKADNKA